MLLGALLLSIALATPADDLARGFRVDDTEGWVAGEWDGGHGLVRGSDGLTLPLSFKRAGEEPAEQLSVGDIGRERAALVVELAARKLRVVDLKGRVVTTPLGEPMVLVEYVIEAAKGFEGEAPNHGARVTRRCGPTVRVTWEGASRQVIWAEADCERFNPRTFHQTVTVAASGPPPRDLPPPHPPKMGPSRLEIGVAAGLILAVVAAFFGFRRGSPSPKAASPSPKPPPRRAPPPEELLLPPSPSPSPSMSLSSKALPSMSPPGAPAGLRKPEPRALGAMGAAEGVWVVPSLPALPQPPPPPPPAAPPPQPPMLAWGAPSTVEAEPAPAPQPLEAPGPSLLHWLHSSNDEDLPQPVAETEAERDAADA